MANLQLRSELGVGVPGLPSCFQELMHLAVPLGGPTSKSDQTMALDMPLEQPDPASCPGYETLSALAGATAGKR